jgi:hypothetical protein
MIACSNFTSYGERKRKRSDLELKRHFTTLVSLEYFKQGGYQPETSLAKDIRKG